MNRSEGNVEKRYKYFMSPYKKFAKFKGVPTPAKFPIPSSSSSHYGGSKPKEAVIEEDEDKENWYRAGDRWGHRRSQSFSQVCIHLHTKPAKKNDTWLEGSCFLARCHAFLPL